MTKISSSNHTETNYFIDILDIESKLGDLTLLLHDETSRKLFRNFLKKEHSEENLDFWMAVDSYRSRDIIRAKYIYSKFLAPGALCEVSPGPSIIKLYNLYGSVMHAPKILTVC